MIKNNRKFLLVLTLFTVSIAVLSGCGGGESSTTEESTPAAVVGGTQVDGTTQDTVSESDSGSSSVVTSSSSSSISADPNSGVTGLTVDFSASGASNSTYQWNFGDNATDSGQSVSHIYNQSGTFTATVTVTDDVGEISTASRNVYVFDSIDNSQVIVPAGVTFYDDFNYSVSRNATDIATERAKFLSNGWSGAKAVNLTGSHAGYLYTVDQIPGYTGFFPGRDSSHVLGFEARPDTFNAQTDFYLQYGSDGNEVPADVWFQFWVYINNYDDPDNLNDQQSHFGRKGKFLYPTKSGYPTHDGLWMVGCCASNYGPLADDLGDAATGFYMHLADLENLRYSDGSTSNYKVGQTDVSERFTPNRWLLVKIHADTSTTSGKFEQWIKPMNGAWTKIADWDDGVTPDFSWQIPAGDVGGHVKFRLGTTFNECRAGTNQSCDFWMYFDDFAMAASEDTLPLYPY